MTATLTNPYEDHEICFDVICDKSYLVAVVGTHAEKGLKPMNIADPFIIPSMLLAQEVRQRMKSKANEINMVSFLSELEDDNVGDPIGSDVEAEDDECGGNGDDACKICCQNVPCLDRHVTNATTEGKEEVDGIFWGKIVNMETIVIETNRKACQEIKAIDDIHGIMILFTLDLTPGQDVQYIFQHPSKYPYTKKIQLYQFCQIKSSLHCSNNDNE
eukprot:15330521-Ditylum_brightwellii.AAC.1